ncbi:MAG: CBS domain-containing protein [Chloroflexi bacterium]|nr:CBS domain-containing protein [Chloroflexota bacterium]MDA1269684.1 CBS domain-containing protein [Chloroflexota bacterium]PKB58085.1 MAG: hypothetical protein BZY83_08990 [SAR202 cluster bacterium Casp-Chloro-G2]
MDQSQITQPEPPTEDLAQLPEEVVQELVTELGRQPESEQRSEALERFGQLHPVDQGEVLDGLHREARETLLDELDSAVVAEILEYLEPAESAEMVGGREPSDLAEVLDLTDPDVAVDVLRQISDEKQQETLEAMTDAAEVTELLQYRDDTAGGLMIPDYPMVTDTTTTPIALDQLRLLGQDAEDIHSVLVVDAERRLVGSLSVTRLALARSNSVIGDIMEREINSVTADTDQEECARMMQRYNLNFLPVVDAEGRLTGVILAEDLVDVVAEEATEDMFRMASVGGERIAGPLTNSLRRRLPWLYINLGTAFLAAVVVSLFEDTISRVVALAVFLPVVAGQGGIGGTQTVTLVVRSMALGEVPRKVGLAGIDPRVGPWAHPRGCPGRWRGGGGLPVEGELLLGPGIGPGHDGEHAGCRYVRRRDTASIAATAHGPGGIVGGVRHHLHRCHRLRIVPGSGGHLRAAPGLMAQGRDAEMERCRDKESVCLDR